VEKRKLLTLSGLELRPLGLPARSQSLYRLRYPGANIKIDIKVIVLKGIDWVCLRIDRSAGFCINGNGFLVPNKGGY
jgi:hypothetical protein